MEEIILEMIRAEFQAHPVKTCHSCKYFKACKEGLTFNCEEGLYEKYRQNYLEEAKRLNEQKAKAANKRV